MVGNWVFEYGTGLHGSGTKVTLTWTQNGLRFGLPPGEFSDSKRSRSFRAKNASTASASSSSVASPEYVRSSSSLSGMFAEDSTSMSSPTDVTIGVAPKPRAAELELTPPPDLPVSVRCKGVGADAPAICRRSEFFAGSPMENEYVFIACTASASSASGSASIFSPDESDELTLTLPMDRPAVPSREHPTSPCKTSPSMRASASALCAAPSTVTPK